MIRIPEFVPGAVEPELGKELLNGPRTPESGARSHL